MSSRPRQPPTGPPADVCPRSPGGFSGTPSSEMRGPVRAPSWATPGLLHLLSHRKGHESGLLWAPPLAEPWAGCPSTPQHVSRGSPAWPAFFSPPARTGPDETAFGWEQKWAPGGECCPLSSPGVPPPGAPLAVHTCSDTDPYLPAHHRCYQLAGTEAPLAANHTPQTVKERPNGMWNMKTRRNRAEFMISQPLHGCA